MARRKTVPGIRPRLIDDKRFLARLRRLILKPYMERITVQLGRAQVNYEHYRQVFDSIREDPAMEGLTQKEVERHVKQLTARHGLQFERAMRRALGIDVGPYTLGPEIGRIMDRSIGDSVALIKTIPTRFRFNLLSDFYKMAHEAPFDQAKVMDLLARNYKSAGYNLRRLTRDQNNKLMGRLSQARQEAVGIEEYVWSTAGDSRVRASHRANEGVTFKWSAPPQTGHPGEEIQCRCVAMAVIPPPAVPVGRQNPAQPPPVPAQATPTPPQAPPAPRPPKPRRRRPTRQQQFWLDPKFATGRLHTEMEWHSKSWAADGPAVLARAIRRRRGVSQVRQTAGDSAYHRHNGGATIIEMADETVSTRAGQAVWRHEFGHAIDANLSNVNPYSYSDAFRAAVKREQARLDSKPGPNSVVRRRLQTEANEMRGMTNAEVRRRTDNALADASLDRDTVERFLHRETPMGMEYSDGIALTQKERDIVMWKFAKAWKRDDPQGLLMVVGDPRDNRFWRIMAQGGRDRNVDFLKHWRQNEGAGSMLSNMLNALTVGERVTPLGHKWFHSAEYYASHVTKRNKEVFADAVAILGGGGFSVDFLRKVVPHVFDAVLKTLGDI